MFGSDDRRTDCYNGRSNGRTPSSSTKTLAIGAHQIESILEARRLRSEFFGDDLFADPAWDMLLELYALKLRQERTSVSKLCLASRVPATTALRWIGHLEKRGLVRREHDRLDTRRWWVELTQVGSEAMECYFASDPALSVIGR